MKKTHLFKTISLLRATFLVALLIFLQSCASNKIALSTSSPTAVISIIGTNMVSWVSDDPDEEDDSDGILTGMVNKILQGNNPERLTAVDRLDYADESIRQILPEITGCEVLLKDDVVNSKAYRNLRKSVFNALVDTVSASDYKDLTGINAMNSKYFMREINAKSIMLFEFNFKKQLVKGTRRRGELSAFVTMKVRVLNEKGREIINKEFSSLGSKRLEVINAEYDTDELLQSINETIDNLISQFAVTYMGE